MQSRPGSHLLSPPTSAPDRPGLSSSQGSSGRQAAFAGPAAAPLAASHALFRQGGHAYLLPASSVLGVVGAEHLRPLPAPVPGWAGTLAVRRRDADGAEAAVPALAAAALLGHGGPPGAVLLLRTTAGPLGLAVERVDRVHALPAPPVPLGGAAGLLGAVAAADEVWLLLDVAHLGELRRAAIGAEAGGTPAPRAVAWTAAPTAGPPPAAVADAAPRAGEPVLVLAERAAFDPAASLAVPLALVRGVSRVPTLRPGPPGAAGVVGYGAWGERVLPAVLPRALGLSAPGPAAAYAVLVALDQVPGAPARSQGLALLVAGVRGIQRLERSRPAAPAASPYVAALGETRGRRRADSIGVGAVSATATAEGAAASVAVLSAAALAAAVG